MACKGKGGKSKGGKTKKGGGCKKMVPMNLYKNIQNLKMIYYPNQYQV